MAIPSTVAHHDIQSVTFFGPIGDAHLVDAVVAGILMLIIHEYDDDRHHEHDTQTAGLDACAQVSFSFRVDRIRTRITAA